VAVYLARKKCGLRLEEIGREFGIEKYSSVSSIVTKTEKQLSQNKELQNKELKNMVDRICQRLDKSQAKI
jgi:chromosomal replication initiation ATPase DnaA